MGDRSTIEWTEATWNPTTGCDRISPGCDNCYAERFADTGGRVPATFEIITLTGWAPA